MAEEIAEKYGEIFKKGTVVEVSSKDEGLRGSWYTATVIRTLTPSSSSSKLLVEYHNLSIDDAGSKPLREYVDYLLIRPIPPRDPPSRRFQLMEDVDAYHNDGWWEGVVTNVIDSDASVKYSVFFRCSREEILFSGSDLRLHREWIHDTVWVSSSDFVSHNQKKRDDKGQIINGNFPDDKVAMNGEVTNTGRSHSIARRRDGKDKSKTSNCSGSKGLMNGTKNARSGHSNNGTKFGVRRNGQLKEHRKKAASHSEVVLHSLVDVPANLRYCRIFHASTSFLSFTTSHRVCVSG